MRISRIIAFSFVLLCVSCAVAFANDSCVHSWESIKYVSSTYSHPGVDTEHCIYCGKTRKTVYPIKRMTTEQKKAFKPFRNFMKAAKVYNVRRVRKCFARKLTDAFSGRNTIKKIFRRYNKKCLSFDIEKVSVHSKKCTIEMNITYPILDKAFRKAYKQTNRMIARGKITTQKALNRYLDKKIKKYAKKYKPKIETEEFIVKTIKTKRGWRIKKYYADLLNSIDCDYDFFFKGK